MFIMNSLDGIEQNEKQLGEAHIILLLFLKPSDAMAKEVLGQFNFYHHRAGKFCSIYPAGFSDLSHAQKYPDLTEVASVNNEFWHYSDLCFVEVIDQLEAKLKNWRYVGEPQLLIFQSNPLGKSILNFQNYISLDLVHGVKNKYIESVPRLFTELINASKQFVSSTEVLAETRRISLRQVVETAVDSVKLLPDPVKRLLKDSSFFFSSRKKDAKVFD